MKDETIEKLHEDFYVEYHNKNFREAIRLLEIIQHKENRKSYWIYSRLSSCYYELKDYDTAVKYGQSAYKLRPESPLVIWDYAGALIMAKKETRGIKLLLKLQDMNDNLTIYGFAEPDKKWMYSLKSDANFLIGKAYYIIRKDQSAEEYFNRYLSQRKNGLKTIYSKRMALDYLKKIENEGGVFKNG